ncbi:MAG TPA: DUF6496 domain-containing protein [Phycisphaerales bacterium]|nr:DUF6496 domain-containing protein [Phycisphaerales bacterium]
MPTKQTSSRARSKKSRGQSASSQAGEYVREVIHKVRGGEYGARSTKQAIAIGLSKARRAGVELPPPKRGSASKKTRDKAKADSDAGHGKSHGKTSTRTSAKRSRATRSALKREGRSSASHAALSRHARKAAAGRSAASRSASARRAAKTRRKSGR